MAEIRYKGQIYSGAAAFGSADDVSYDNTTSGLTATDVQGAVDELDSKILSFPSSMSFSIYGCATGESVQISLEPYARGTIFIASATSTSRGLIGFYCNGSGTASVSVIVGSSTIGVSASSNKITLANNGNASFYATVMHQ